MNEKKKLRCPLGIPGGVIALLIGLTGIILNLINFDLIGLLPFVALFLLGGPFVRVTMMVYSANDRLDELERKIGEK